MSRQRGQEEVDKRGDNVLSFTQPHRDHKHGEAIKTPLLNIPRATFLLVCGLFSIFLAVNIILPFMGQGKLSTYIILQGAFIPELFFNQEGQALKGVFTLITYALLHAGWLHLGMNALMLVAIGSGVERYMGASRFVSIFLISSIGAAVLHFLVYPNAMNPLIGASGGIGGLFGAILYWMYRTGDLGAQRSFIPTIIVFMVVMIVFGLMGGPDGASIAWVAHLGGFLSGILLTYYLIRRGVS